MDFDKTVSEAHLKASGWDLGAFRHSSPFDCHFVYVSDFNAKDVRLFSVNKSHLESAPMPEGVPSQVLAFLLAESLADLRRGVLNPADDHMFLPKLIGYVKCTKAYALWRSQGKAKLHFIINVYRSQQGPEKAMLRPFVANCDDVVLTAADMMAFSKEVFYVDKSRHPEWF